MKKSKWLSGIKSSVFGVPNFPAYSWMYSSWAAEGYCRHDIDDFNVLYASFVTKSFGCNIFRVESPHTCLWTEGSSILFPWHHTEILQLRRVTNIPEASTSLSPDNRATKYIAVYNKFHCYRWKKRQILRTHNKHVFIQTGRGVNLTTHLKLVTKLRLHGAIPPLTHVPMAWC